MKIHTKTMKTFYIWAIDFYTIYIMIFIQRNKNMINKNNIYHPSVAWATSVTEELLLSIL